ncbi:MAG: hypothetical protein ACQCXQ_07280 [Verrucomicrobiales bacterium]|nr:hypothetical protein [Verrucomicrobiota bacterium JB025]
MTQHWTTSYRDRFTTADFDFVASVLWPEGPRDPILKLWQDPEGQREMLDLKEVLLSLIDSPSTLQVSPLFYFYVLVRHAFIHADLTDASLADYVAGVMAKRVCLENDLLEDVTRGYTHAAQFLSVISRARGRMRFHLQVAAGNQFLVLTGLYPDYLRKRSKQTGAPGLEFYETFTKNAFRGAAECEIASAASSRHLLSALAEAVPTARRSLNRLAEELVFLGE